MLPGGGFVKTYRYTKLRLYNELRFRNERVNYTAPEMYIFDSGEGVLRKSTFRVIKYRRGNDIGISQIR